MRYRQFSISGTISKLASMNFRLRAARPKFRPSGLRSFAVKPNVVFYIYDEVVDLVLHVSERWKS